MGTERKDLLIKLTFMEDGTPKIKKVTAAVTKELDKTTKAAKAAGKGFKGLSDQVKAAGAVQGRFKTMLKSTWAQMAMGMGVMSGISGLFRTMSRSIRDTIKEGRAFEKAWANVTTMLWQSMEGADAMKKALIALLPTLGDTTDLAKGMYQVLSAAIDPAKAIMFLAASAKAAVAGVTNVFTAVDALTSVINAYSMAAERVTRVSDVMFQTVIRGKLTYEGMATTIGTVVPIAAKVGISFHEIAAAMATLTRQGIDVNTTTVQLRQILISILKPKKQAMEMAAKLGIQFNAAALRAKGLAGFLLDVQEKTHGSAAAISQMFGNVRALTGVLGLAGATAAEFAWDLDLMTNAMEKGGQTAIAFQKQMQSLDFWLTTLGTVLDKLKLQIWQGFAEPFMKGVKTTEDFDKQIEILTADVIEFGQKFGKSIGNVIKIFTSLIEEIKIGLKVFAAFWIIEKIQRWGRAFSISMILVKEQAIVLSRAMKLATASISGFLKVLAFIMTPIGAAIIGLGALTLQFFDTQKKFKEGGLAHPFAELDEAADRSINFLKRFEKAGKKIGIELDLGRTWEPSWELFKVTGEEVKTLLVSTGRQYDIFEDQMNRVYGGDANKALEDLVSGEIKRANSMKDLRILAVGMLRIEKELREEREKYAKMEEELQSQYEERMLANKTVRDAALAGSIALMGTQFDMENALLGVIVALESSFHASQRFVDGLEVMKGKLEDEIQSLSDIAAAAEAAATAWQSLIDENEKLVPTMKNIDLQWRAMQTVIDAYIAVGADAASITEIFAEKMKELYEQGEQAAEIFGIPLSAGLQKYKDGLVTLNPPLRKAIQLTTNMAVEAERLAEQASILGIVLQSDLQKSAMQTKVAFLELWGELQKDPEQLVIAIDAIVEAVKKADGVVGKFWLNIQKDAHDAVDAVDEFSKQMERQLANAISSMIRESKTLEDAWNNMFKSMLKIAVDYFARIVAEQIAALGLMKAAIVVFMVYWVVGFFTQMLRLLGIISDKYDELGKKILETLEIARKAGEEIANSINKASLGDAGQDSIGWQVKQTHEWAEALAGVVKWQERILSQGSQSVSDLKALDNLWGDLIKKAIEFGQEGSKGFIDLINAAREAGIEIASLTKYIDDQLGLTRASAMNAAEGLEAMSEGAVPGLNELMVTHKELLDQLNNTKFSPEAMAELISSISGVEVQMEAAKLEHTRLVSELWQQDYGSDEWNRLEQAVADAEGVLGGLKGEHEKLMKELESMEGGSEEYEKLKAQIEETEIAMKALGSTSVEEMARLERQTIATFNAMMENGATLPDALESLGPALDNLIAKHEAMGTVGGAAIQELLRFREVTQANKELFAAIQGNVGVLTALANTNSLTQEIMDDSAASALDYHKQLLDAGLNGDQALMTMVPTLQKLAFLSKEHGFALDDATQALIDQAKEQNLLKDEQMSVQDAMLAGFGLMIQALGSDIPEAMQKSIDKMRDLEKAAHGSGVYTAMEDVKTMSLETFQLMEKEAAIAAGTLGGLQIALGEVGAVGFDMGDDAATALQRMMAESALAQDSMRDLESVIQNGNFSAHGEIRIDTSSKASNTPGSDVLITNSPTHAATGYDDIVREPFQPFIAHQGERVTITKASDVRKGGGDTRAVEALLRELITKVEQGSNVDIEPVVIPKDHEYIIEFVKKSLQKGDIRVPVSSVGN